MLNKFNTRHSLKMHAFILRLAGSRILCCSAVEEQCTCSGPALNGYTNVMLNHISSLKICACVHVPNNANNVFA